MEPEVETVSLASSHSQHVASSTSVTSDISDSACISSRFLHSANSSDLATSTSRPVVVSSDSGIFTDRSEQIGDMQASRSSSVLSVDRSDITVDKVHSAVRRSSSGADRPTSALARGVQIVDYPRWNPKPLLSSNEESLVLMEEYLCPQKLVRLYSVHLLMLNITAAAVIAWCWYVLVYCLTINAGSSH